MDGYVHPPLRQIGDRIPTRIARVTQIRLENSDGRRWVVYELSDSLPAQADGEWCLKVATRTTPKRVRSPATVGDDHPGYGSDRAHATEREVLWTCPRTIPRQSVAPSLLG